MKCTIQATNDEENLNYPDLILSEVRKVTRLGITNDMAQAKI
jgi:hypothetical protein